MKGKKLLSLCLTCLLGVSMVGCAASNKSEAPKEEVKETVEKTEERIIASSVSVVEILDAMGISMVGVPTSSYDLPESVKEVTRIGNPMKPDMEIVKSLDPTTVVSVDTLSSDLKESFNSLNIPIEFLNLSSYEGLKSSIVQLGETFDKQEEATKLVEQFKDKEEEIAKKVEGQEGPSVLVVFGASGSFMVATESTYVGDLVKKVGGKNILEGTEGSFIPVDMEFLADKNPDVILLMTHANPEESKAAFEKEFETNEAWQHFDAVKNDKVYALEPGYFGMSANLLATDAMEKLVEILYSK
ncbi:MAG: heme ABC transporter substrate-binding protein IsdE [Clostridium sp.]